MGLLAKNEVEQLAIDQAVMIGNLRAEIERLTAALEDERKLKQGWIDEYVKLRDMGVTPDEY